MAEQHQVVIVGGGPVGVGLAVELGLRDIDCVVIERRRELPNLPKGQNLTSRTLEHFYFWGIEDELRDARIMPKDYPIGGVTAYGNLMSEYWFRPRRGLGGGRAHYYVDGDRMPQYRLEAVLRKKIESMSSVKILYETTVKKVEQDANGVSVTYDSGVWPYDEETIVGDYVIGCDGTRSIVREQLGIKQMGSDFEQKMVLAVFSSTAFNDALERFPHSSIYRALDPEFNGYPFNFGRVVVGESFFFLAPVPNDTSKEDYDFQALLNRAAGFEFEATFDHVGFWDLKVSVADKYQVGRAFIAGDSAHSHPPFGGFGLNNGLEDITNLGWKLAAVLHGWGGDKLLDSYSEERRPVFWEVAEDFIARGMEREGEFLNTFSPEKNEAEFKREWKKFQDDGGNRTLTYEPNYEGSPVVIGPEGAVCSAHGSFEFAARPGHHLSPQPLSGGRYLPAELGAGFTLLALSAEDDDVQTFVKVARSEGVPLTVVKDTREGGRQRYEYKLILVRPDQHVVWVGDNAPNDPGEVMRKVTGRT